MLEFACFITNTSRGLSQSNVACIIYLGLRRILLRADFPVTFQDREGNKERYRGTNSKRELKKQQITLTWGKPLRMADSAGNLIRNVFLPAQHLTEHMKTHYWLKLNIPRCHTTAIKRPQTHLHILLPEMTGKHTCGCTNTHRWCWNQDEEVWER